MRRVVGGLALLLVGAAAAVAYAVSVAAAFAGPCANEAQAVRPSPSGRLRAVVFERDCGATTGTGTHVSVLDADGALPNEGGNAFVAETRRAVEVRWNGDGALVVRHGADADVFLAAPAVRGVRVLYEPQGER